VIKDDAIELKEKYGDERRTLIMDQEPEEFSAEDMVAHQEVVVTLSKRGFIKRLPLSTYRAQRRGGVGVIGMKTRDDDAVRHLIVADTHDKLVFFTDRGRCFQLKVYEIADESRQAKGESIMQLITLDQKERVTAVVRVPERPAQAFMVVATQRGEVKKTPLKNFENVRRDGLIAMNLEADDELVAAKLANDQDDLILVTARGQALRFKVASLRSASRLSGGVRGIKLVQGDTVVGLEPALKGEALLVASELGMGKRTDVDDYPRQGRGGQGVITFKTNPKSGELITARTVHPDHELMLISEEGIILRTPVNHISLQGRSTQGVTLMDVSRGDRVSAIAVVDMQKEFTPKDSLPTGVSIAQDGDGVGPKKTTAKAAAPEKGAKPAARGKPATGRTAPKAAKPQAKAKPAPKAAKPPAKGKAVAKAAKPQAKGKAAPKTAPKKKATKPAKAQPKPRATKPAKHKGKKRK
jgi:DNA gyrase subunit A